MVAAAGAATEAAGAFVSAGLVSPQPDESRTPAASRAAQQREFMEKRDGDRSIVFPKMNGQPEPPPKRLFESGSGSFPLWAGQQ